MKNRPTSTAHPLAASDESAVKALTLPDDISAMLHNLISLHLNGYVYANHHHIRTILVRAENGVWAASRHFPKTVCDFVMLNAADMAALQQFYDIKSVHEGSLPAWRVETMLFHDIASAFGLTYWLQECPE